MKKKSVGLVIGKFEPLHEGHLHMFNKALELVDELVIVVGGHTSGRRYNYPFTQEERVDSIKKYVDNDRIRAIDFVADIIYNEMEWISNIYDILSETCEDDEEIYVIGHDKDFTSSYLHKLNLPFIDVGNYGHYSSTSIREQYFLNNIIPQYCLDKEFMKQFMNSDDFLDLKNEYLKIKKEKELYKDLKYPYIYSCADAFVLCRGHILLIKRKDFGRWALPGGHLNVDETTIECSLRELKEETGLELSQKNNIGFYLFDHPRRSDKGRVISNCYMFYMIADELPIVKACDDAVEAKWIAVPEFYDLEFHDDHFSMIYFIVNDIMKKFNNSENE